jgi:hypothetical protein
VLGELEVDRGVAATGLPRQQRDRAERPAACDQRHDHVRGDRKAVVQRLLAGIQLDHRRSGRVLNQHRPVRFERHLRALRLVGAPAIPRT